MLLFLTLLLAACQAGPRFVNYRTGTDGVTIAFSHGTPPAKVYEESAVPFFLTLWNQGATDVPLAAITLSVTSDPFYAQVRQAPTLKRENLSSETSFPYSSSLLGKQPGYEAGEQRELTGILSIRKIKGLRESPTSELYASICYPYLTAFSDTVCVDTNAYNQNRQRQVCQAQTLTYQDQGAPVAVTMVENRPTPLRGGSLDVIQPTFIIHIRNKGGGAVLMPVPAENATRDEACAGAVARELRDKVGVNATLSGRQLRCDPDPVLLQGGEGYTTCVLDEGKGSVGGNYLGVLSVRLDYLYREGASASFTIQRRAPGAGEPSVAERDAHPGYVNGEPRCDYCSAHRSAPECKDWPAAANKSASFTCACGQAECLKKAKLQDGDVRCVYGASWCPGSNYCCVPG